MMGHLQGTFFEFVVCHLDVHPIYKVIRSFAPSQEDSQDFTQPSQPRWGRCNLDRLGAIKFSLGARIGLGNARFGPKHNWSGRLVWELGHEKKGRTADLRGLFWCL